MARDILCIGAGKRKAEAGVVRVDVCSDLNPEVVWDLNETPWCFPDSSFDEIECYDVIEHLEDIGKAMQEMHRILRPDGVARLTTPHFSCANSFTDPTHRHHLGYFSFDYFTEGHPLSYYTKARFLLRDRAIAFDGGRWNRSVMARIANRKPDFYEKQLCWIFPAWFMSFELQALK